MIEKLLNNIQKGNLAEDMDEQERNEIAMAVVRDYEIDKDSREKWLEINQEAMDIIHMDGDIAEDRDYPFKNSAKVIYPLLTESIIQFSSMLIPHIVRGNKAMFVDVHGEDPEGLIQEKATAVSKYVNYDLLKRRGGEWVLDSHKAITVLVSWGVVFKRVKYSVLKEDIVSEILHPQDVIINANVSRLSECPRYTILNYINKNNVQARINAGEFCSDIDPELLYESENLSTDNDPRDSDPIQEIAEQYRLIDMDDDGYAEPYIAYVHIPTQTLLGLYAAYDVDDIILNEDHKLKEIKSSKEIIDFHCIDDPDGGFYSLGLNHLLLNLTLSATHVLRSYLDASTRANSANGFVTKALKTKGQNLRFTEPDEFKVLDVMPDTDINKQFAMLPYKDVSPVAFQLLGFLTQAGEKMSMVTEVLSGETLGQNTPATNMLAMIENGTRAFKPVVQKLMYSQQQELRLRFKLYQKYLSDSEYREFHNNPTYIVKDHFNLKTYDVCPVADPNLSSEAHKYMKWNAILQSIELIPNKMAVIRDYMETLELPDNKIQEYLTMPQPQGPNPDEIELQLKVQEQQHKQMVDQKKLDLQVMQQQQEQLKVANEKLKTTIAERQQQLKEYESAAKVQKMQADARKDSMEATLKDDHVRNEERKLDIEERRVDVMERTARYKADSEENN